MLPKIVVGRPWRCQSCLSDRHKSYKLISLPVARLRVVPHFSSGIVGRAKRERAWKSPQWGTTRSLTGSRTLPRTKEKRREGACLRFSFVGGRVRLEVGYKIIGNSYKPKFVCSLFVGVLYCQITKPCLCGKWQIWVTKVKTKKIILSTEKVGAPAPPPAAR